MAELQKISDLRLEDLPDEMIVKVLSYVNISDLMRCGNVSKRFGKIRETESLWKIVDLRRCKAVKPDFIKFLLDKGCERLNLLGATIAKGSLKLDGPSKLRCLSLRNDPALKEILNSCHILQKLSLEELDFDFVKQLILRNSKTLQTINMVLFDPLKDDSKVDFFGCCLKLTEFKITGITNYNFRSDQLDLMIDSLPPNLLKVEFSHFEELSDLHIEKLVRKCDKITAISLFYTCVTNQSVTTIVRYLKNSLEVLDLQGCQFVSLDTIFEAVRNLTQLKILFYECEESCMKYAKPPKMCGTCESLMKKRPGLITYGYDHGNMIAYVDKGLYDD